MSLLETPPEKQNFRTCGKGTGGVELKAMNRIPRVRPQSRGEYDATSPSIPSRQMTSIVAGAGEREAHGFGSHAMRFHEKNISLEAAGDAPGPGSYGSQPTFHQESGTKTSLGVKGTGSFASKTRRFRPVPLPGPGPGKYDQDVRDAKPQSMEGVPRLSAPFVPPQSHNPAKSKQSSPGPGTYCAKDSARASPVAVRDCSAAFQTGKGDLASDRDPFRSADGDKPGPGHYSARSSSTPPGATGRFKGPISRPLVSVKAGLPTASVSTADTTGDFVRKVGVVRTEVPGPGQYEQDTSIESRKHFNAMGTSSFQKGFSHQPRKWQGTSPGPSDYVDSVLPTSQGAKSSFNSCSHRTDFAGARRDAPGPAFYSPKAKKGAESFHLNIRRKWL